MILRVLITNKNSAAAAADKFTYEKEKQMNSIEKLSSLLFSDKLPQRQKGLLEDIKKRAGIFGGLTKKQSEMIDSMYQSVFSTVNPINQYALNKELLNKQKEAGVRCKSCDGDGYISAIKTVDGRSYSYAFRCPDDNCLSAKVNANPGYPKWDESYSGEFTRRLET